MGYELEHTSQLDFDGTPLDCLAYNTVFGDCKPVNRMLHDVFSGLCTLLNYTLGDFVNVGLGAPWYLNPTNSPYQFKSFITLPGLSLTDTGDELSLGNSFISNNGSMIFAPVGLALDIKATGGMSFVNIGTGTGDVYNIFAAGFFQMRRINYGFNLAADSLIDKGFIKPSTVSDDVVIQERKGGYATADYDLNSGISIGVWVPSIASTPFPVNEPITINKAKFRHIIADNIMIINYDIDIEFELDYAPNIDGNMLISFSQTAHYSSIGLPDSNSAFSFPLGGGGQTNYRKITQNLVYYDLGIGDDKDDVDKIEERYSKKTLCEAKLSNDDAQIGNDYEWPQLNGAFDQLLITMIPVLNANKNEIHRFVSRGTIIYGIYPRGNSGQNSIADLYDSNANIEKNF